MNSINVGLMGGKASGCLLFVALVTVGSSMCWGATRTGYELIPITGLAGGADNGRADSSPSSKIVLHDDWQPWHNSRYLVPNDPLYSDQWHLSSADYPDTNIENAWERATGAGVVIGIVDDSLQHSHPDLSPNYISEDSWDFGQDDGDPSPVHSDDNHGTSVGGVAAAKGNNTTGVVGAAFNAGVAGLRIDFPNQTQQMFADATEYHSTGESPSIGVKNHSYGTSIPYSASQTQVDALVNSANAGTIHTFAAGNERSYHGVYVIDANGNGYFDPDVDPAYDADANKKHTQSASESIAVAALASDGKYASYSNWGANVVVTAPSSGSGPGITTTDRTDSDGYASGDYTDSFGGTSSSSPLVAGILALGKELRPDMDGRMAKHLLARTSAVVDSEDAEWMTNGAGYSFNPNYGFGLIDADAFTDLTTQVSHLTEMQAVKSGDVVVEEAFGGETTAAESLTRTLNFDQHGTLEEMMVYLDITHDWRGDVEAYLSSPSGTLSRLMTANPADSFDIIDWQFVSNAFWGEDLYGEWTLEIVDTNTSEDDGTWNSFNVTAQLGDLVIVPEPTTLVSILLLGLLVSWFGRRSRS